MTNTVYRCVFSALLPGVNNPSLEQSSLFPTLDDFLATHPAWSSLGARLMIWLFYLGPVFFIGRVRTLGGLTPEDRERYLLAWEKSPAYPIRQGLLLLKMLAAIGYGGDPRFQRSIGYAKPHR